MRVALLLAVSTMVACVSVRSMETADTLGAGKFAMSASAAVGAGEKMRTTGSTAQVDVGVAARYGISEWLDARLSFGGISGLGFGLKAQLTPRDQERFIASIAPDVSFGLGSPDFNHLYRLRAPVGVNAGPVQIVLTPAVMQGRTTAWTGLLTSSRAQNEDFYGAGGSLGMSFRIMEHLRLMLEVTVVERWSPDNGRAAPFAELAIGYSTGGFGGAAKEEPRVQPKTPPSREEPPPPPPL